MQILMQVVFFWKENQDFFELLERIDKKTNRTIRNRLYFYIFSLQTSFYFQFHSSLETLYIFFRKIGKIAEGFDSYQSSIFIDFYSKNNFSLFVRIQERFYITI